MEPLIHKASVNLTTKLLPSTVSPGDEVILQIQTDGTISVTLKIPSRIPFGLGKPRGFVVGTLAQSTTEIISPALEKAATLRVRVVQVEPSHLSRTGQPSLSVSVWGDPTALLSK